MTHETIVKTLIKKAEAKQGKTNPNPVVAAAVVKNNQVIAYGVHQQAGGPHAEVIALKKAGKKAKGATLYITLEPCTHHGKTPPCTQAIIDAGITHVIYAMSDPNPKVKTNPARAQLQAHNIQVDSGVLEKEARAINQPFIKNQLKNLPYITLKAATSLDGKIALSNKKSKYLTSEKALYCTHQLRAQHDAILVGIGTVLADNPRLNVRYNILKNNQRQPTIIILDPDLKTPPNANLFQENQSIILITDTSRKPVTKEDKYPPTTTIIQAPPHQDNSFWKKVLKALYKHGITSILIEGGSGIFSDAIQNNIVDKLHLFVAPKLLGSTQDIPWYQHSQTLTKLSQAKLIQNLKTRSLEPDIEITGHMTLY